jgi:hypothetical protein
LTEGWVGLRHSPEAFIKINYFASIEKMTLVTETIAYLYWI